VLGSVAVAGEHAGINDQGQISKLLTRLHKLGLILNTGEGHTKGTPNQWTLTTTGQEIHHTIGVQTTHRTPQKQEWEPRKTGSQRAAEAVS
jgi:hypothetical protein